MRVFIFPHKRTRLLRHSKMKVIKRLMMLFKRIMTASLNREKTHLRRYKYFNLHAEYVQYKGN